MRIFLLDNYDSFTWNLHHYLEALGADVVVKRNDEIGIDFASGFDRIVLSPGPGLPAESGILMPFIAEWAERKPMLGVCLGMQAIAEHFGARLKQLPEVAHGISTSCTIADRSEPLFAGIDSPLMIGRYHSWVVDEDTLPGTLKVTSRDEKGRMMSMRHHSLPIAALQFHPESVLTPEGMKLLQNWLNSGG